MALIRLPIGAQTAFFIGDYTATSTPLTRIWSFRTGGAILTDSTPSEYLVGINARAQTELRQIRLSITFLADNDTVYKLAGSVPLTGSVNDGPTVSTEYTIFLANPSELGNCYVIPKCSVIATREVNYNKDKATGIRITFEANTRDPDPATEPLVKGSITTLNTLLAGKAPFS